MSRINLFRRRNLISLLLIILLMIVSYAFAAANTVPGSNAGDGSGAVSGYTVSNISYALDATDPSLIDSVTFTVSPGSVSEVQVQLVNGGSWFNCNVASAPTITCNIGGAVTALAANVLRVVAVQ